MFGKNYDAEINKLTELNNKLVSANNNHVKNIDDLRDNMINIAKIQAQHKAIITFLLNHATVDADDIMKVEKEVKKIKITIKKSNAFLNHFL